MIGIVLVTQGTLGVALRETMEHVVGPQPQMATVSVGADDDLALRQFELQDRVAEVDTGDGVMLITDMFGSTPSNLAVAMVQPGRIEVLGGANLPMLVKLAKMRDHHTLAECAVLAEQAAHKYISCASQLPAQCLEGARRCAEGAMTLKIVSDTVCGAAGVMNSEPMSPPVGQAGVAPDGRVMTLASRRRKAG